MLPVRCEVDFKDGVNVALWVGVREAVATAVADLVAVNDLLAPRDGL